MARSDPQFNLRIPEELKSFLKFSADRNKRSLNAEITKRLAASIKNADLVAWVDSLGGDFDSEYDKVKGAFVDIGYTSQGANSTEPVYDLMSDALKGIDERLRELEGKKPSSMSVDSAIHACLRRIEKYEHRIESAKSALSTEEYEFYFKQMATANKELAEMLGKYRDNSPESPVLIKDK